MKDLPYYKIIEIKSWDDLKNSKITKEIDNSKCPIVLNLEKLSPITSDKLYFLEDALKALLPSYYYPYPVFCIGTCPNYFGQLSFFNTKSSLPKFYSTKSRVTSKLHSELLHYNQIAQREYECINFQRAEDLKIKYAHIQKKIFHADAELRSINHIYSIIEKIKE
jgi:hypothetical protein